MTGPAVSLIALLEVTAGCRAVIGADDFSVGERLDPCGALEVRTPSGCARVGVSDCGDGFSSDGHGGCNPILPPGPCGLAEYARPGLAACSNLANLGCSSAQGEFGLITDPIGPIVYVGGTQASGPRYDTLEQALSQTTGDVTIALSQGSHTANVEITGRKVLMVGVCPDVTSLVAGDSRPIIKIGPGADGSRFEGFAMTGNAPGIAVSSAADVTILGVWLHDLGGIGITFDDVAGWSADAAQYKKASGLIERTFVHRATDIGIAIYGSQVELRDIQIGDTQPLREGLRAIGLSARPSPSFSVANGIPIEQARRPSILDVSRTLIENSRGAGVLLEGATATFESTVVRGVAPDLARHGRGIDARAHVPGRIPMVLALKHSLIENTYDVGLRSWNADSVVVEDSVVRDVGEAMEGRCLGNGIRARYDLFRDADLGMRLEVRRVLVERTRQAGVLIEGGQALVEESLIRQTRAEPCRSDFGDGIAVHDSAVGPSSTEVRKTRIVGAARAGVASFRSDTTVDSVVVDCSKPGLAAVGRPMTMHGALCACAGEVLECEVEESLEPSLIGGGGVCNGADSTGCYRGCSGTILKSGSVLEQATTWIYDHDEIPSVISNDKGCYDIEGLPLNETALVAIVHDTHASGLGMMAPLEADSSSPYAVNLAEPTLLSAGTVIFGASDLRTTYLMQVRACSDPKEPRLPGDNICKGLPGLTASLSPGPVGPPIYWNKDAFPDPKLTATDGADIAFHAVPAGEHFATLHAPAGQGLECGHDVGGIAWTTPEPARLRVLSEEGFPTILAGEVNCRLVAP